MFVLRARVPLLQSQSICLPSLGFEHLALPSNCSSGVDLVGVDSLFRRSATPATNTDSVPEQALLQIDAGPVSGSFLIVTISLYVLSLCSAPSAGGLFLKRAKLVERYEIKIPRYVKAWQMGTTFSKVTQPLAFWLCRLQGNTTRTNTVWWTLLALRDRQACYILGEIGNSGTITASLGHRKARKAGNVAVQNRFGQPGQGLPFNAKRLEDRSQFFSYGGVKPWEGGYQDLACWP
ncbi:hypothetical protein BKA70DRAFT_1238696 [Coprinopsis sp. MPI-PUGE-AT-0042]|nr:hypothetical protein BKA70DRAFT_1238696 [Coprinopsis sp. MPI-PUGE-AT-0042]